MAKLWFMLWVIPVCLQAQVYRWQEVDEWRKQMKQDSVMQLEYRAALHFHKLLNNYRSRKKLDTLVFDPLLWLTAYNHSVYMRDLDYLGHTQGNKNALFTGAMPGDRYDWTAGGTAPDGWSAENVLVNFSGDVVGNMDNIARHIAEYSFTQWKNSKPHHENMTGKEHGKHGVAFAIKEGKVWGTDFYSRGSKRMHWPEE